MMLRQMKQRIKSVKELCIIHSSFILRLYINIFLFTETAIQFRDFSDYPDGA